MTARRRRERVVFWFVSLVMLSMCFAKWVARLVQCGVANVDVVQRKHANPDGLSLLEKLVLSLLKTKLNVSGGV
jgi:hypothetical protein